MSVFFRIPGDGTAKWAGSTLAVTINTDLDTWSYDTELGLDYASGVDVAQSVVDWANDAARPASWTMSFSWATINFGVLEGLAIYLSTGSGSFTPSADLSTLTGWDTSSGNELESDLNGVVGSVRGGALEFTNYVPKSAAEGGMSGKGGWVPSTLATAPERPDVEHVGTNLHVLAIGKAQMYTRGHRQAHFYDTLNSTYRLLSVGNVSPERLGPTNYRTVFQVLG